MTVNYLRVYIDVADDELR